MCQATTMKCALRNYCVSYFDGNELEGCVYEEELCVMNIETQGCVIRSITITSI